MNSSQETEEKLESKRHKSVINPSMEENEIFLFIFLKKKKNGNKIFNSLKTIIN